MPELIDIAWFSQHTASRQTLDLVSNIAQLQTLALTQNKMPIDTRQLELELDGDTIILEASSAVNALEVYQEIFRDTDHCRIPGFSPEGKNVIVDLGANYGFYALLVKRLAPDCRLIALEPNPYLFPLLRSNLSKYRNTELLNVAIGPEDRLGAFELVRQVPSIGGLTLRQVKRQWISEEMIESCTVEYASLPTIFDRHNIFTCDILKIDIEGLEGELLASTPDAILRRCQRIVLERHTPAIRQQVIDRLCGCGFSLIADSDPQCLKHYGNLYFERAGV